jgi:hypothetical protein
VGEEKCAVQVVDFVAESAGEQAFPAHFEFLAGSVLGAQRDVERAGDVTAEARQ